MKKKKLFTIAAVIAVVVLACCIFAACDPNMVPLSKNSDVVKAFNAITPTEDVVTQTASASGNKFAVTVITTDYVTEYVLDKNFKVEETNNIVGDGATAAEEGPSALEQAYAKALELSGLAAGDVTGFDFDRDKYMNRDVYKVEIEEIGAKYKYVFAVADFALVNSEIEFETDMPKSSYIGEDNATDIALKAAGARANAIENKVVRSELEDGVKLYKVSFNFEAYRYDVSVNAINGDIVKFSKSALENRQMPAVQQNITVDQAKETALQFVFPNGENRTEYNFRKAKPDYEDGRFVYEVELNAKNSEYEFEISAQDGTILDVEIEGAMADTSDRLPQNKQFITREEAIAAVKAVAGNDIYVIETEIDKEGGEYFYEIEVRVNNSLKREYKVNALTGEVVGNVDNVGEAASLTEEDALAAALKAFDLDNKNVSVRKIKLEREDSVLCYDVEFYVGSVKYEAEIDATTGRVIDKDISYD